VVHHGYCAREQDDGGNPDPEHGRPIVQRQLPEVLDAATRRIVSWRLRFHRSAESLGKPPGLFERGLLPFPSLRLSIPAPSQMDTRATTAPSFVWMPISYSPRACFFKITFLFWTTHRIPGSCSTTCAASTHRAQAEDRHHAAQIQSPGLAVFGELHHSGQKHLEQAEQHRWKALSASAGMRRSGDAGWIKVKTATWRC
jgi:hypothetical protein